jgi:peroxiredoxin Q/BCP
MGREFMGTVRSTFIIEKNKIIKEWRNVKAAGHAAEVLDFIKNY